MANSNERTALNTNQYHHHDDDDEELGAHSSVTSSISPTSAVVDFYDDLKKDSDSGDQLSSSKQNQKQHKQSERTVESSQSQSQHSQHSQQSHHITEHVPFYLLYFLLVYIFMFLIQLGMLVVTVDAKWFHHRDEPTWVFPIDVMVVSMLTIEVAAHFMVSMKFTKKRGCIMQSIKPQLLVDFAIVLLSIQMIVVDVTTEEYNDNDDNGRSHAFVGLLRDTLRIVRISEFVYILKRVLGDPDWHTNDSLSMDDVL